MTQPSSTAAPPRHIITLALLGFALAVWAFIEGALILITDLTLPLV